MVVSHEIVSHCESQRREMAPYKLTYFNSRGRAEVIRLIFAVAEVEYEDVRLQKDQWNPELKKTMPFGQVPTLEFEGKVFSQSNAIARYLARKFNLAGKTELEQLQVDMLVDCMEDTVRPLINILMEQDETRKATLKKKYSEEQLPASLGYLEKLLTSNGGGDGFLVGEGLTWGDLIFLVVDNWNSVTGNEGSLENFPKLKALKERVEKVPKVAEWIAKRPVTQF